MSENSSRFKTNDSFLVDSIINNEQIPYNNEFGKRISFDSLHFSIIRRWFDNGNLYIESITDNKLKVQHWKEFYENGNLKKYGTMIYSTYIGKWHYYSEKGKLDSVVDYEKKYNISYHKALEIANKNGYEFPAADIGLDIENNIKYWRITKWKEWENEGGKDGTSIMINCKTGEVTKPEYEISGIY